MATNRAKKVFDYPVNTAASSESLLPAFQVSNAGSRSLRVDVFTGKVAGTGDLVLQDSTAYGIWNDVKTVALAASTDSAVTFDLTDNEADLTAHGFSEDSPVVFNTSGTLPNPLRPGVIYFASPVSANSFKIKTQGGNSLPVDLSGGTGSHTVTALGMTSIIVQEVVSGDQADTPVRSLARVKVDMDTAETCQVCAVWVTQGA